MMLQLQIVAGAILAAGLLYIINMIRKRRLELKYALAWILAITVMLLVDIFPAVLNLISYLFGIATPVNTLFLLGFIFSLIIIFMLTVVVSRQAERQRKLTQVLALNQEKISELQEQLCYYKKDDINNKKEKK